MNLFDFFGGSRSAGGAPAPDDAPATPSLDRRDKFALVAAAIADGMDTLQGRESSGTLASTQKMILSRAQRDKVAAIMGKYAGGASAASAAPGVPGETATAPARSPIDLRNPAFLRDMAVLKMNGGDPSVLIEGAKANRPDIAFDTAGNPYDKGDVSVLGRGPAANRTNVNGHIINTNDPTVEGKFFGDAPVKGAVPVYGPGGAKDGPIGWRMADGSLQAIGQATEAETAGRTRGTMFNINNEDGSTTQMLGGDYLSGRGGAGGGRSQSPADKEYESVKAKDEAAKFQGFVKDGQSAPGNIARLQQMGELLKGYNGNALSPVGTEIARFAAGAGFKIDPKLGNKEAADALSNQLVLDLTGGSLGVAISNADRSFLQNSVPRLSQSADGRQQLVAHAIKGQERKAEVARRARAWEAKAGRLDKADRHGKTFYDYLDTWSAANPLFPQGKK